MAEPDTNGGEQQGLAAQLGDRPISGVSPSPAVARPDQPVFPPPIFAPIAEVVVDESKAPAPQAPADQPAEEPPAPVQARRRR